MSLDKKVNLFIVGAMKAGTTSFVDMISQHPDIYFCPIKEPNYFVGNLPLTIYSPSKYFMLENYFNNEFPNPLHIAKVEKATDYNKLFSAGNSQKYYAEASTVYLHAPESARMIHDYNSDAKIIVLTREPLKRAYSHFLMNVELGRETKSFNDLLSNDIQLYNKGQLPTYSYLGMSIYDEHIKRYQDVFGKENVLTLNLSSLKIQNNTFFSDLYSFLKIDNVSIEVVNSNSSKSIRNPLLVKLLYSSGIKDLGSKILPKVIRTIVFNLLSTAKKEIQIDDDVKTEFEQIIKKNTFSK